MRIGGGRGCSRLWTGLWRQGWEELCHLRGTCSDDEPGPSQDADVCFLPSRGLLSLPPNGSVRWTSVTMLPVFSIPWSLFLKEVFRFAMLVRQKKKKFGKTDIHWLANILGRLSFPHVRFAWRGDGPHQGKRRRKMHSFIKSNCWVRIAGLPWPNRWCWPLSLEHAISLSQSGVRFPQTHWIRPLTGHQDFAFKLQPVSLHLPSMDAISSFKLGW